MKELTDSQKIDRLNQRLKRMEASQHLQTAVVILGFLGIFSFASLAKKFTDNLK